jgi:hypothetical protein
MLGWGSHGTKEENSQKREQTDANGLWYAVPGRERKPLWFQLMEKGREW